VGLPAGRRSWLRRVKPAQKPAPAKLSPSRRPFQFARTVDRTALQGGLEEGRNLIYSSKGFSLFDLLIILRGLEFFGDAVAKKLKEKLLTFYMIYQECQNKFYLLQVISLGSFCRFPTMRRLPVAF
jgi:hypothetical protein